MQLPFSQACENNKSPILNVLQQAFSQSKQVLEVGGGTGQHAVYFARELPHLVWQTSDQDTYLDGLRARLNAEGAPGQPSPVEFDVFQDAPAGEFDALFSANTCHIMPTEGVEQLFWHLGHSLTSVRTLCLYGPFNSNGQYTSDSNAAFDASLKARDPAMGIRDAEWIFALAKAQGFQQINDYALPANNRLLVFTRTN